MRKYISLCFSVLFTTSLFYVSLGANTSSLRTTSIESIETSTDSLHFYIDELEGVQDLSTYTLPVSVNNCSGVSAFQFTLELENNPTVGFNSITLLDGVPGQLNAIISPDNKQAEVFWSVNGGLSLPDSSAVLEIELSLSATGGCVDVNFTDTPITIEASLASGLVFSPSTADIEVCFIPSGYITGNIYKENDVAVAGVEVRCIGPDTTFLSITDQTGKYEFLGLTPGEDYLIIPFADANPDNGLTIFDILKVRDYILSPSPSEVLTSPYQLIAADVSGDGSISLLDVLQIRDLRLEILAEFPGSLSWFFIPVDYTFPVLENPWVENYPQSSTINNLPGVWLDLDFIAIKTGDVNLSAVPFAGQ